MSDQKAKGPGGRPSAYKPEFCGQIIDLMADGYSVAGAAGKFGVSRQTVYNWSEQYPEFLDALKVAQSASALWWEDRLRGIAAGTEAGNASAAIFGVKNRVADEWRDKHEIDHRSPDGSMSPALHQGAVLAALSRKHDAE